MRKNNKGFTMIEILGALIIMGVLLMIAVPGVTKLMKSFRTNYYDKLEKTITASAKDFYTNNRLYKPDGVLKASYTSISSLIDKDYVEKLVDYKGKSCSLNASDSYVIVVYRGEDKYEYHTCLKCPEDKYASDKKGTYCDEAWLTNDNIKYNFGEKDEVYIYYNTSRDEVRNKLLNSLNVVKYNKNGDVLDKVKLAEGNLENLLPSNIDELDTSYVDEYTNMNEVILKYKIENEIKQLKAIIYKHQQPKVVMKNGKDQVYISGNWANKVIITLSKNDDFFDKSNTYIGSFQVSINDGEWKKITCEMRTEDSCSFSIAKNTQAKYRFRIVTNEGKISNETHDYVIKVDVDKPTVGITPNGDEPIVYVGSTSGILRFQLTTSDTGGSGIKNRKYIITQADETPSGLLDFFDNVFNYNSTATGNTYKVWAQVEDIAGNISTGVYPSNVFHFKYEVKFDPNGGLGGPTTMYKKHGTGNTTDLTLSASEPLKSGYNFDGWSTTKNGEVEYLPGETYKDNKAIILYAVWSPKEYTVTFDPNGGSVTPTTKKVVYNSTYGTLPTPTKKGYTFVGWYTDTKYTTQITSTTLVSILSNQTLYAKWEPKQYTVTYNGNGGLYNGSSTWSEKSTFGEMYTTYDNFFTRKGYTFTGWIDQNGTNWTGDINKPWKWSYDYDVTLYAQWRENVLTVNYYSNFATSAFSGALNTVGASKNVKVRTTTHGYTENQPDGLWNYSGTNSSTYLGRTGYTATGNYGTSTSGGKIVNESTSFSSGQALAKALGETLENGDTTVNVYPQWEVKEYTVTYDGNGGLYNGLSTWSEKSTFGEMYTTYDNFFTRKGYTFTGWIDQNGTNWTGDINKPWKWSYDYDVTLYAQWEPKQYTVTYNGNGGLYNGLSTWSEKATYGVDYTTYDNFFTRGGYTFTGWKDQNGTNWTGDINKPWTWSYDYDVTLYAQWTAAGPPSHQCISTTRTKNTISVARDTVISYYFIIDTKTGDYLAYQKYPTHWCTSSKRDETCFPHSNSSIAMYEVTCSICGKKTGANWCPVHGAKINASDVGGRGVEICDASTKTYSSGAENCYGKNVGWTLVSK